jgi:hypothetical protein
MRTMVVGVLADALGACARTHVEDRSVPGRIVVEHWSDVWSAPASEYRSVQPGRVRLDISHVLPVGTVMGLAEDSERRLWACAEVD